jgi:TIR domain
MEDSLIGMKRAQRKALLRGMYGLVDGREGFTITPMQYFTLGTQIGLQQDVAGQTVRFLVSEGLLEYKPASQAVALTHKGVVEIESQSDEVTPESQRKRQAQLSALPDRILGILKEKSTKIQMEELKEGLPDFGDLSDSDWYAVINDLLSDGMINAGVARSGIYGAIGAAYNIEITPGGRALTPEQPIRAMSVPTSTMPRENPPSDVFISHATEDKPYVQLLVEALEVAGIKVWFDKTALEWGDDLRTSIDRGLKNCRYGIVIFSKAFLRKKKWTEYELNSLFALEQPGRKIILPIWHGITRDDVLEYGAGFADRLAKVSSKDSYDDIVESLLGLLGRSPDQKQDVSEVTLEAFYFNHDPDRQTFRCRSVSEMPAKYVDDTGADGSVMRSELEPPLLIVRGIDVKAVEELRWKPTGLRFKDVKTGDEKLFPGQLHDTVEPDTLKFAFHGGDAKSETNLTPQAPVTAKPVAAKPNAIAYAWYETKGENAVKAKAFIRPSTQHDGWFSFENSFGEELHGTKEEIAMKFAAFDKSLTLKHYVRMQHSTSDAAFNLG